MKLSHALLGGILGVLVVGALAGWRLWYAPRAELLDRAQRLRAGIDRLEDGLEDEIEVRERLAAFASTTLADEPDVAQHEFRKLLGQIAQQAGLADIVVSDRPPRARTNPAVEARSVELSEYRGSIDVYEIEGTVAGVGLPAQAMACLAAVESQVWVHRVGDVSIQPVGRDRERVELRIKVTTYFAPDLGPDEPPSLSVPDPALLASAMSLSERNLFRPPPPEPVQPEPVVVQRSGPPPPPPPAPYGDWRVVGVTRASEGPRAIIRSNRGASRTLAPGERVLGLEFQRLTQHGVVFAEGDRSVEVRLGATLAQRVPASG